LPEPVDIVAAPGIVEMHLGPEVEPRLAFPARGIGESECRYGIAGGADAVDEVVVVVAMHDEADAPIYRFQRGGEAALRQLFLHRPQRIGCHAIDIVRHLTAARMADDGAEASLPGDAAGRYERSQMRAGKRLLRGLDLGAKRL